MNNLDAADIVVIILVCAVILLLIVLISLIISLLFAGSPTGLMAAAGAGIIMGTLAVIVARALR